MLIDPFRLCVAVLPLATYFLGLGLVNLSSRPLVLTGAHDLALLGVGLSGLMVVGPLELFVPTAAAVHFGQYVWLFLLALYGLGVTFLVLLAQPRLVIYNVTDAQLRPLLAEVVAILEPDALWAGSSLALPRLAVELSIESFPALRHVSLVASGWRQDLAGWSCLRRALAAAMKQTRVKPNVWAAGLIGFAVLLSAGCLYYALARPEALAEGWHDLLRH